MKSSECTSTEECKQYLHFDLGVFGLEKLLIQPNDMLSQILSNKGVEYFKINQLIESAKSIFPFRSIRSGKELTFITDRVDSSIHCVIYEPDPYHRILYHLDDSVHVEVIERPTVTADNIGPNVGSNDNGNDQGKVDCATKKPLHGR